MQVTDGDPTFRPTIGLLADFTADGGSCPRKVEEAEFEWIDRERILNFFSVRDVRLNLTVSNTLSADGSLLPVRLGISSPSDFGDLNIIANIPALKALDRHRRVVDAYLGEGPVRDVARWILATPDLTLAARNSNSSMQSRFQVSGQDLLRSFESCLTDSQRAAWLGLRDMLASSASVEDLFETVAIAAQLLDHAKTIASERLRRCDELMEGVKRELAHKIDEQIRVVRRVPQFDTYHERWQALTCLVQDIDVAVLDCDPRELTRDGRASSWKCWGGLGSKNETGDIFWCDHIANGTRVLRCLVVDAHLRSNKLLDSGDLLRRCADVGRQLQLPVLVSMRPDLFDVWRGVTGSRNRESEEAAEEECSGNEFGKWVESERAMFLVAARCVGSSADARWAEGVDDHSDAIADDDGIGYYESLSLVLNESAGANEMLSRSAALSAGESKLHLAVSPAWRQKTNLEESEALAFLLWLSRASCICRRAATQAATQDPQRLVEVLRSQFRGGLLFSLQSLNTPFGVGNPDIAVTRYEWDARRFNCTMTFKNCSFQHVFTIHRQT